jgi:hypothetical protein
MEHQHHNTPEITNSSDTYYCPMHPYITSKQPGNCPECGMKLEKMEKQSSGHQGGHGNMVAEFKRRFWISLLFLLCCYRQ